jgi:anti-anti-sigma factor
VGTVKVEFASPETAVVTLVGEHDLNSRLTLRATLTCAAEGRNMLIDLGLCTFADSAIVSLLLATERALGQHERRCELIIPPDAGYVTRLFEITGIAHLFRVHTSLEAGLESMAEPVPAAARGTS